MSVKVLKLLCIHTNSVIIPVLTAFQYLISSTRLAAQPSAQGQSQTIKPPIPNTRPAHNPTPNPTLKLPASFGLLPATEPELPLELCPVAAGALVDGLEDEEEEEGVCVRTLVAAAGVDPENVSDRSRKESVVGEVNFALRGRGDCRAP